MKNSFSSRKSEHSIEYTLIYLNATCFAMPGNITVRIYILSHWNFKFYGIKRKYFTRNMSGIGTAQALSHDYSRFGYSLDKELLCDFAK